MSHPIRGELRKPTKDRRKECTHWLYKTADGKLIGFTLRLKRMDHLSVPSGDQPDLLAEAGAVFSLYPLKAFKAKTTSTIK
jgi:hypothetical protein